MYLLLEHRAAALAIYNGPRTTRRFRTRPIERFQTAQIDGEKSCKSHFFIARDGRPGNPLSGCKTDEMATGLISGGNSALTHLCSRAFPDWALFATIYNL